MKESISSAEIMVSVCMITHKHEPYIAQAIEGVLSQVCDFKVELIVADDCSPDETETIVNSIILKHENGSWIKYSKHKINKGPNKNFIWATEQCRGKYIALCEGDDYWIDPNKLQRQIDFLENNRYFNLTAGNNFRFINGKLICDIVSNNQDSITTRFEYWKRRTFHLSTVCFRNDVSFPSWFSEVYSGDKFITFLASGDHNIFIHSQFFSVYRVHPNGLSSIKVTSTEKNRRLSGNIVGFNMIKDYFEFEDRIWLQITLDYQTLILRHMNEPLLTKCGIILKNLFFLIKVRNKINLRMIFGHFFK